MSAKIATTRNRWAGAHRAYQADVILDAITAPLPGRKEAPA
jgi:hypothetical protein